MKRYLADQMCQDRGFHRPSSDGKTVRCEDCWRIIKKCKSHKEPNADCDTCLDWATYELGRTL